MDRHPGPDKHEASWSAASIRYLSRSRFKAQVGPSARFADVTVLTRGTNATAAAFVGCRPQKTPLGDQRRPERVDDLARPAGTGAARLQVTDEEAPEQGVGGRVDVEVGPQLAALDARAQHGAEALDGRDDHLAAAGVEQLGMLALLGHQRPGDRH